MINGGNPEPGFNYASLGKTIDDCLKLHKENGDPNIVFGKGDEAIGITREKELEVIEFLKG